jgi:hypothetical protein
MESDDAQWQPGAISASWRSSGAGPGIIKRLASRDNRDFLVQHAQKQAIAPMVDSSKSVRSVWILRTYCSQCHKQNGQSRYVRPPGEYRRHE